MENERVTVRKLIHLLMEEDLDAEVILRDENKNRIKASIDIVKERGQLGCLFG